jgi:hypothetical protein
VIVLRLPSRWSLFAGILLGMTIVFWWLLPEALMPGWISNWQFGAWGEQATAKQLRRLPADWTVRHDVASAGGGNRDHVVAGGSVFLLDTKNLSDSMVTVEGRGLRVQAIEDTDKSYLLDRFPVARSAYWLERDAESELGFPVAIYPVVVVWARFDEKAAWIGKVAVVRGDLITDWLESRPPDIARDDKRADVARWARNLRHAD